MFAFELTGQMNSCIINIIKQDVYVTFLQIVKQGTIKIWNFNNSDGNNNLNINRPLENTNFESFNLGNYWGKVKIEVKMDGQQITKEFIIG